MKRIEAKIPQTLSQTLNFSSSTTSRPPLRTLTVRVYPIDWQNKDCRSQRFSFQVSIWFYDFYTFLLIFHSIISIRISDIVESGLLYHWRDEWWKVLELTKEVSKRSNTGHFPFKVQQMAKIFHSFHFTHYRKLNWILNFYIFKIIFIIFIFIVQLIRIKFNLK